jgi:hypothetical protein
MLKAAGEGDKSLRSDLSPQFGEGQQACMFLHRLLGISQIPLPLDKHQVVVISKTHNNI